jgi:hypothetical protein
MIWLRSCPAKWTVGSSTAAKRGRAGFDGRLVGKWGPPDKSIADGRKTDALTEQWKSSYECHIAKRQGLTDGPCPGSEIAPLRPRQASRSLRSNAPAFPQCPLRKSCALPTLKWNSAIRHLGADKSLPAHHFLAISRGFSSVGAVRFRPTPADLGVAISRQFSRARRVLANGFATATS